MNKKNLILTTKSGHQFKIHSNEVPNGINGERVAETLNKKYKGGDYEVISVIELDDEDIHGDWFINLPDDFGKLMKETETPPEDKNASLNEQWHTLKEKHPDALLLFRCGDLYETWCEDAQKASEVLGITLTISTKEKEPDGRGKRTAAFPYHALDTYLPKLIRNGIRVAICDQIEPKK